METPNLHWTVYNAMHSNTQMNEIHWQCTQREMSSSMSLSGKTKIFLQIIALQSIYFFAPFNKSAAGCCCFSVASVSVTVCFICNHFSMYSFAFEWMQTWTYVLHEKYVDCESRCVVYCWRHFNVVDVVVVSIEHSRHYYVNGISNRFVMLLKKQYTWLQFINTSFVSMGEIRIHGISWKDPKIPSQ